MSSDRDRSRPGSRPGETRRRHTPAKPVRVTSRPTPRPSGRGLLLLGVVAVLAVSYASSLRAYLDQRAEIDELKSTIADRSAAIDDMEREIRRWKDPEFVRQQARARFSYVMPGETAYVVLDENGEPLEPQAELTDTDTMSEPEPNAFWGSVWESVELAADPPEPDPIPARTIDGSDQD